MLALEKIPSQFTKYSLQSGAEYSLPDKAFKLTHQFGSQNGKATKAAGTRIPERRSKQVDRAKIKQ